MGNATLTVELDLFSSVFSIRCAVGKTDARGADLYEGGIGDILPRLLLCEVRESGATLSARVEEGIGISKSFEVLVRVSGCFTNGLRFAIWACAEIRFIAGRNDIDDC